MFSVAFFLSLVQAALRNSHVRHKSNIAAILRAVSVKC